MAHHIQPWRRVAGRVAAMCDVLCPQPTRIAVIEQGDGREPPLVRWRSLSSYAAHDLPGLPGLAWVGAHATDSPPRVRTALRRQATRLARLRAPGPDPDPPSKHTLPVSGFVGGGAARRLPFGSTTLGGHRYHLLARGLTDRVDITTVERLRIVVGCCLFGAAGVRMRGPAGVRGCPSAEGVEEAFAVEAIEVDHRLGLYEWETILRITALVGDLVAAVPRQVAVTVVVDVPKVQYYPHLLPGYAAGTVSRQLLMRWWTVVDQRQQMVITALRRHLRSAAKAAGRPDVQIEASPGLDTAAHALGEAISSGGWPSRYGHDPHRGLTRVLLRELRASPFGGEWRALLGHLEEPGTLVDLALASYVWQLIRPNLLHHMGSEQANTLTLMLDDISEHRLYTVAQTAQSSITRAHGASESAPHPLTGIFPLRQAFHAGQPAAHSLFHSVRATVFRTPAGRMLTAAELATDVILSWQQPAPDRSVTRLTDLTTTSGLLVGGSTGGFT